ncbi:Guanine nucleotide-binding protein negative regulator 1 [Paramyrothecium foliicola]|nr:Guanine nucleotide-binding protein negative regulator 1 [Paramyrothecium foliicola]
MADSEPAAPGHEPDEHRESTGTALRLLAQRHANGQDGQDVSSGGSRRFFASARWSADGTSLLVGASDQTVTTFVLSADLLEPTEGPRALEAQATVRLPEPSQVIAPAPYFSLADPTTQTFLVGCRDHPLQLYHVFPEDEHAPPVCAYKLIRKETEEYITPSALLWQYPGTHFICGSANRIDMFDMSKPGSDGPVVTVPTIPSRRHISKGSGVGMKGTVAALAASPPDADGGSIIAAGTWTRWIGLYDLNRTDRVVANWSISDVDTTHFNAAMGGQGISQIMWSPCGRYLIVNERHADGLLVYDIRGTGQALSILSGRATTTQQRLNCDVFSSDSYSGGFEVWAGSDDGTVHVWDNAGSNVGLCSADWSWKAHDAPIGSTVLHSSGSVAATCSGGWKHSSDSSQSKCGGSEVLPESSLRVWSIGAGTGLPEASPEQV